MGDSMASIETGDNASNNINKSSSSKKNKRKHKAKSLVVSTPKSDTIDATATSTENAISLSAECDSSTFSLRPRFSFRKFGRNRSSSKQSLNDLNSNASSTSSSCTPECVVVAGASNNSIASPSPTETNLKCPTIIYSDADGALKKPPPPPPPPPPPRQSKLLRTNCWIMKFQPS